MEKTYRSLAMQLIKWNIDIIFSTQRILAKGYHGTKWPASWQTKLVSISTLWKIPWMARNFSEIIRISLGTMSILYQHSAVIMYQCLRSPVSTSCWLCIKSNFHLASEENMLLASWYDSEKCHICQRLQSPSQSWLWVDQLRWYLWLIIQVSLGWSVWLILPFYQFYHDPTF